VILALPHGHGTPAFNGLFYATAATIIPVLFLALVLQGAAWRQLLQRAAELARAARAAGDYISLARAWVLAGIAYAIVIAAMFGEGNAIGALYRRSPPAIGGDFILWSAIILNLAVVAVPVGQFSRTVSSMWSSTRTKAADVRAAEEAARQTEARRARGPRQAPRIQVVRQVSPPRPKWAKRAQSRTRNGVDRQGR
jgi:uncharacterized membrane protein